MAINRNLKRVKVFIRFDKKFFDSFLLFTCYRLVAKELAWQNITLLKNLKRFTQNMSL